MASCGQEWEAYGDDERIYQTVRPIMSAKYTLMANSYQMAYWSDRQKVTNGRDSLNGNLFVLIASGLQFRMSLFHSLVLIT
jgi:hypothetical protein